MKTLLRGALFRAMIGTALGMLAGVLLCQRIDLSPLGIMLTGGAYGGIVMGATVLYDIERWSLTRATLCHLLVTLAGFCALGLIQGWLSRVPPWMPLVFIAVYFAIWLVQWMTCYQCVCRINDVLRRRRCKGEKL